MAGPLKPEEVELDGYLMGPDRDIFVQLLDPGVADVRGQDAENPIGDGRVFGRDYLTGPTWNLELVAQAGTGQEAVKAMRTAAQRWRKTSVRLQPGKESVLRYEAFGETFRVYGRPRKFAFNPTASRDGKLLADAEFATTDHRVYADAENKMQMQFVPPSTGGFTAPFTVPIMTVGMGERQGTIQSVGGDTNAPFQAQIFGPISEPWISGDGWKLQLRDVSLKYDQSVTFDTRKNTVLRNDGVSLGGYLTRGARLANAQLRPGADQIKFGGIDATATSYCEIRWRAAYASSF